MPERLRPTSLGLHGSPFEVAASGRYRSWWSVSAYERSQGERSAPVVEVVKRIMTMRRWLAVALLVLSWPALARQVELPLTFGFPLLRQTLLAELFTEPNATARVWQADGGCSDSVLSDPQVDAQAGRLRILSIAHARFGTAVGAQCTMWFDWQGLLEVHSEPTVRARQREIAFRVAESKLYDADGRSESAATKLWDRIKHHVHPQLARVRVDLDAPLRALEETLPLLLPRQSPTGRRVS